VEGRMDCVIKMEKWIRGKIRWRIVEIYINRDLEKKMDGIKE